MLKRDVVQLHGGTDRDELKRLKRLSDFDRNQQLSHYHKLKM
jgi:hypothetical protein